MKERKLVRQFTLDTEIYDAELPQKVLSVLRAEPLETDPHFYYGMSIVFDKAVYQTRDFFQYPLEKMPPSPPGQHGRAAEQDQLRDRLSAILRQQLSRVSSVVRNTGIDLSGGAIIGDDLEQSHQVTLEFYEEREKEYDKKGRLKQGLTVNSIMPDRPFIAKKAAELIVKTAMEKATDAARKEQEQASHTPHMVLAGELFSAAAKTILLDQRKKTDEDVSELAYQLRLHAEIKSDWPLEIAFVKKTENTMAEDFEIDCPEFLLYHENSGGNWTLKKVNTLAAAQTEITKRGYNLKTTARMAVLHHLKPLGFSLFADTAEGLVKVKKQEAAGKAPAPV